MDMGRPMNHVPSIFNVYWGITKFVMVLDIMMVPVMVQKGITVANMIRCHHTKKIELTNCRVVIHLGQGRVH